MKSRDAKVGKAEIRLRETKTGFGGVVLLDGAIKAKLEDQNSDRLWERLHQEAAKLNPNFVGYDGARTRFLKFFPGGFTSEIYLRDKKLGEREYKWEAKKLLDQSVPLDAAHEKPGFGEAILAVFRKTNLLEPRFETARVQEALRGPQADEFIRGAATFALGNTARGLAAMAHALKPHGVAKWTVVTYLPFLWRPETHMFLKPNVTRKFASRVGHRFDDDYTAKLEEKVYESLLDLIQETRTQLTDLAPRDNIDIQSFIWVVGE